MQSIASLMSIGRASDIGDMGDLEEEEDAEDDTASRISDATACRISEMTSQFNTSVTEEDGSAQAAGMTNGPMSDHSKSHRTCNEYIVFRQSCRCRIRYECIASEIISCIEI